MALKVAPISGDQSLRGNPRPLGIPAKTTASVRQPFDKYTADAWTMQRQAQRLLNEKKPLLNVNGVEWGAGFVYRVASCHRGLQGIPPAIYGSRDRSRAEYRDVQTCGSVWHCPICAPKISSERRDDLSAALAAWKAAGGAVFLLTYTHSHEKNQRPLAEQDKLMRAAYSKLTGSRAYREAMQRLASPGTIRAVEVTHGEYHGWHPHIHALVFVAPGALPTLKRLKKMWVQRLIKAGLSGLKKGDTGAAQFGKLRNLMRHALDIRDGQYAADYVAKFGMEPSTETGRWGLASEATKGHTKRGERLQGRTPFALLKMAANGDKCAGDLFREYALAFNGRRQLVWSRELRERLAALAEQSLNLDLLQRVRLVAVLRKEKTDEEAAANPDRRCTEKIIRLDFDQWRLVLSRDARFELLKVAAEHGEAGARRYLDGLRAQPPTHSDEYYDDLSAMRPVSLLRSLRRAA